MPSACGSGNFLYVALEHLKRLEGEVLETLASLGETQQALEHTGLTVDPHQLLGIKINSRAAVIADLVLWIGYLQWHFRTRGDAQPPIPVIRNFHNIEHRDALMSYSQKVATVDADGIEVTEWNGVTFKQNAFTGKQVPDETARRTIHHFLGAKPSKWPEADFIVGNTPFIGGKDKPEPQNTYGYVVDGHEYAAGDGEPERDCQCVRPAADGAADEQQRHAVDHDQDGISESGVHLHRGFLVQFGG